VKAAKPDKSASPAPGSGARAVNNDVYRRLGHAWWDEDVGEFSTIRFFVNPVRFAHFSRVLGMPRPGGAGATLLDVGCGGGLLAEEFARAGLRVTGIDPSAESIETARCHAAASALAIDYVTGCGERLPFEDRSFDNVACCDVLEHVDDVDRVIAEIARVLKPGGLFLYDTINRTRRSRVAVIKVMQDWRWTAFADRDSHVWERFIRPVELKQLLNRHGLAPGEMRGISTRRNPVGLLLDFNRRVRGKITFRELGRRLDFHESDDLSVSYMGHARRAVDGMSNAEW
jgi:2-polyprenyl-6-hydroxyphenyl methylase/3-demethylubiquinone-9 3-methyltransferase